MTIIEVGASETVDEAVARVEREGRALIDRAEQRAAEAVHRGAEALAQVERCEAVETPEEIARLAAEPSGMDMVREAYRATVEEATRPDAFQAHVEAALDEVEAEGGMAAEPGPEIRHGGLTDAQHAMRATGIGGSEIAAVAGLSPYATPLDVWRAKVEGYRLEETLPMKRGRILEPALAEWYAEDTGAVLEPGTTLRHPSRSVALATPDRIASLGGERWVLELKTANFRTLDQWGEAGTDAVPQHYLCQVAWEMACAGLERADLAVLIAGDDFRIYHLVRDRELEEMLLEEAERFWFDHVATGSPPPLDGSESCAKWLASKYPKERGDFLSASPEVERLAGELRAAIAQQAEAKQRAEFAKTNLKALIGDAPGVEGSFGKISWKTVKGRTAWKAVAKALNAPPALITQHTAAAARRFTHPFKAADEAEE